MNLIPTFPEEHALHARLLASDAAPFSVHTVDRADNLVKYGFNRLTPCERIVALHLKFGLSNKEISSRLHKCEPTVKNQVAALLRKLGVPSRTRLVALLWSLELAEEKQRQSAESFVVCGSSVRRVAAEECVAGRVAGVRRPASSETLVLAER
ncbi:MAG: LuxR C-terminal-related transcriptional regulator [Candidatus Didemnitutus sp.]|nr:LuxR C-terminal-related transcriptional regulator [Candidatus Didemnitutus sp.]